MEKIKAPCPYCKGEKNCHTIGYKKREWSENEDGNHFWAESEYKLLECMGCDGIFTYIKSRHSEDYELERDESGNDYMVCNDHISTYPTPEQEEIRPTWFGEILSKDYQLYAIMEEMYIAFQNKSLILAAIGLRTIFDRTVEVLKIHPGHTLGQKVDILKDEGFIGEIERNQLKIVTEAGNSAAHRAWEPNEAEFKSLLVIIENFVMRTILKDEGISRIAEKLPEKHPRPPKNKEK
ncbi:DUF4145 domain-containing protein [Duffyella gerundensis]|uniref:DUF4145 domain-containing protein n=1 Tax=Duffyella gerundensis TaxID=1619313 RepID=UPI001653FB40|nr:DUF4145 domain-containing protein [Duffyella gerundensis]